MASEEIAVKKDGAVHGGVHVARALKSRGVEVIFTLSGGHLFSIYDGCVQEGIKIIDVRHEQSAVWAAEGYAKATRKPGVCALTAGPGVTNGISAITGAKYNNSPVVVLGGRAPEMRWGSGSLQEIDHLPLVSPVVKSAETVKDPAEIAAATVSAIDRAMEMPSGPVFVDYPLDVVFMEAEASVPDPDVALLPVPDVTEAAELLAGAERPVIMAGTGVYWGRGEEQLREFAEALGAPVFLNGMGRGCVPASHELCFSRARGAGLGGADVALVVGVPLDFRLGFGEAIAADAKLIQLDFLPNQLPRNRQPDVELVGDIASGLRALGEAVAIGADPERTRPWVAQLGKVEAEKREAEQPELNDDRAPLHPMRIYKELAEVLDEDAIVIGDGGDFVSYAGKLVETEKPGCWMDPGPFGCLGAGPGQAIGAKVAFPHRQVCLLLGDGAFGFSGIEFDTMVRHGLGVVGVVGNNGIWGLEEHPMQFLYGYSVAARLNPGTRYDSLIAHLGALPALVEDPSSLEQVLAEAFDAKRPALVNVLTDDSIAYPRRSNLA